MSDEQTVTMTNAHYATIRKHKAITWSPQADITAHELASLLPLLIAMTRDPMTYWEDYIPSGSLRHFTISDR